MYESMNIIYIYICIHACLYLSLSLSLSLSIYIYIYTHSAGPSRRASWQRRRARSPGEDASDV